MDQPQQAPKPGEDGWVDDEAQARAQRELDSIKAMKVGMAQIENDSNTAQARPMYKQGVSSMAWVLIIVVVVAVVLLFVFGLF